MRCLLFLILSFGLFAQKKPEDFGYRYINAQFEKDTVHILAKSKSGEDLQQKPLFIFIQGSLAKPILKYEGEKHFPPFPFSTRIFEEEYHLIVINKPGIPYMAKLSELDKHKEFVIDSTGLPPKTYLKKNVLDYYVERNSNIVDFLKNQSWVDSTKIVVAGHSEGSTIALKMAEMNPSITHVIYSGGTPYYSRIMSIISQDRQTETDSSSWIENDFEYWQNTLNDPFDISRAHGYNTYKGTYSFSQDLSVVFKKLKQPILVSYGTKDSACPYNDLLRVEMINENKTNITFKAYVGLEHNYFPLKPDGTLNYNEFNWDIVALDWKNWLLD